MNNLCARVYVLSRISIESRDSIHKSEGFSGVLTPCYQIAEKHSLEPVGDIPSEMYGKTEKIITAIYERFRGQYRAKHTGCCFPNIDGSPMRAETEKCRVNVGPNNLETMLVHLAEKEFFRQNHPCPVPQSGFGNVRNQLRNRSVGGSMGN